MMKSVKKRTCKLDKVTYMRLGDQRHFTAKGHCLDELILEIWNKILLVCTMLQLIR